MFRSHVTIKNTETHEVFTFVNYYNNESIAIQMLSLVGLHLNEVSEDAYIFTDEINGVVYTIQVKIAKSILGRIPRTEVRDELDALYHSPHRGEPVGAIVTHQHKIHEGTPVTRKYKVALNELNNDDSMAYVFNHPVYGNYYKVFNFSLV